MRQSWGEKVRRGGEAAFGRIGGFVGVYSGRLKSSELLEVAQASRATIEEVSKEISDIGLVWQRAALEEIVDGGVIGKGLREHLASNGR
jgi:hypothetical protein